MSESPCILRGIVPPMVTPLSGPDTLDLPGLERLVEHILAGGVHGLFVLGTTGEAPGLSLELRHQLVRHTCRLVGGRVPVLVGISDTSFAETLGLARTAAKHGASALVLAPPYYFPNSQQELLGYFERLIPQLPLPLYLYNMPSHTKTFLEIETVERVMEMENVAGIKDSSGNMVYFHRLVRMIANYPDRSLFMGPEELLAESVLLGGHGGVCGGANLCPGLYVDLYEAAMAGDVKRTARLHQSVMAISETLYKVGQHGSAFVKGVKCALNLLGICDDFMAEPFYRFGQTKREAVRKYLEVLSIKSDNPYPKSFELVSAE